MKNVKMKAVDTIHISALGPDNIPPKGEFEVSEEIAADLEKRGLATRVGAAKKAEAPANKKAAAPANKAARAPLSAASAPVQPKRKGR